jgi:hypothetical protein
MGRTVDRSTLLSLRTWGKRLLLTTAIAVIGCVTWRVRHRADMSSLSGTHTSIDISTNNSLTGVGSGDMGSATPTIQKGYLFYTDEWKQPRLSIFENNLTDRQAGDSQPGVTIAQKENRLPESSASKEADEQALYANSKVVNTVFSRRGKYRIEERVASGDDDGVRQLWVVAGGQRRRILPGDVGEGEEEAFSNLIEFWISPNGKWIYCEWKVCHGVAEGRLYERVGRMEFRPAFSDTFDSVAWDYIEKRYGLTSTEARIIDFVSWSRDGRRLRFKLRSITGYTRAEGWGWTGYFDTVSRKFGTIPRRLQLKTWDARHYRGG